MEERYFDVLIIGTGAAGYNAADCLFNLGVKNIAIITENINYGTSRNTGSDKQTYYKLSLSGDSPDSIDEMSKTLFDGGSVDYDVALAEAANSVKCFMKLVSLGVEFPTNKYGEYVGYKTDHDPFNRATSIGPYTSKRMTEVLQKSVESKNILTFDKYKAVKILTKNNKVIGLVCLNINNNELVTFKTSNIILATGGPAGIYYNSVYPISQLGSSSLAYDAGCNFANMAEWQYGLASITFRWNVSGTYQQVLPRYISIDEEGVEREFLREYFASDKEMIANIFLKGYQWPFDVRKINGSSYIDLLVYNETVIKKRKVYLDFLHNPSGLDCSFNIDEVSYAYLKNSNALLPLPIDRLNAMNKGAIDLYKEHGIDLYKDMLQIAVCAQHCNGGVDIDANWESNVKGLYVAGEAAASFGVFRPGGSALNSTQVGSLRAAEAIKESLKNESYKIEDNATIELNDFILRHRGSKSTLLKQRAIYQKFMSEHFAFIRDINKMEGALKTLQSWLINFSDDLKPEIMEAIDIAQIKDIVLSS